MKPAHKNILAATGLTALGAGIGAALFRFFRRRDGDRLPGAGVAVREGEGAVRSAGPEGMRSNEHGWTSADEASDESFPASDPPSTSRSN